MYNILDEFEVMGCVPLQFYFPVRATEPAVQQPGARQVDEFQCAEIYNDPRCVPGRNLKQCALDFRDMVNAPGPFQVQDERVVASVRFQ